VTVPSAPVPGERWAVAALDHFAALAGYHPVPEGRPRGGGWRRLYLAEAGETALAVLGPADGAWASLGVEVEASRARLEARLPALVAAVAPFDAAVDPDAGADDGSGAVVVRVALRVFLEGLTPGAFRDAVGTLSAAAAAARRALS
jgi:hypothetical protein